MKKLLTWVVGGAFLLSLPAMGLAQKEETATAPAPAVESQAPKAETAATQKTEKKETTTKKAKKAKTTKAKKSKTKAKKAEQQPS